MSRAPALGRGGAAGWQGRTLRRVPRRREERRREGEAGRRRWIVAARVQQRTAGGGMEVAAGEVDEARVGAAERAGPLGGNVGGPGQHPVVGAGDELVAGRPDGVDAAHPVERTAGAVQDAVGHRDRLEAVEETKDRRGTVQNRIVDQAAAAVGFANAVAPDADDVKGVAVGQQVADDVRVLADEVRGSLLGTNEFQFVVDGAISCSRSRCARREI